MLFMFMTNHGDQAYDDNKWIDKSKPPEDASKWAISQSYRTFDDSENGLTT
ncbi:3643_t:CDS:2 [Funneliformis caledonium]|uniref:3643_t:CDS:1 n=1 Tax=Funneliformis caledonium TaxID=1117310 RepID=A0A9N9GMQ6_9GLOM|nr:3643_t:CDS:2 [Funneliformis caledonium]